MTSIQSDLPESAILTLYPPWIPRAAEPVVGANIGVPLHIYDLTPMGLVVVVDPYLNQEPGDTVSLNLNGQTNLASQQTDTENSVTKLYLPKKMLLTGIVNRLTYTVTRGSLNMGTSEPPLEMLYNAVRPGNVDRSSGGNDGHSELELILPDEIKDGVGPDFPVAGAQVCVSYPYCRAYDVIRLNCNGHLVYHTVTPSEAPPPPDPGSDTPTRVCFTVTRADLEQAKDHAQFIFSYTVTDQLGNTADPNNPWSTLHIVDVDLAGNRLPAAILREILDDANDDPSIIDLKKLGNNVLSMIALTNDNRFQRDDSIKVTYIASLPGQPDVMVQVTGIVETDAFGQKKPCILQVPNDKVPANSVVQVSYQLIRNGVTIATSKTANARVIGEQLPDLLPPSLIKSTGGVFDPLDPANLQGATGRVEVMGYRPGDTVQLIVTGAPGAGSPTFQPKPLNTHSQADFQLDKAFIAANMGKQVTLRYVLFRDSTPHNSQTLSVLISKIPDNHPELPTPAIDGATGNELDVSKLQPSALLHVGEWPQQVSGQPVWLRYDGVNEDGTIVAHDDRRGEPHTTVPGFTYPVPLDWLKTLKNGSEVRVVFRVNFDGVSNSTTATSFRVRSYIISTLVDERPEITSVKGGGVEIPDGSSTPATSVSLTGTATAGQQVQILDGNNVIVTIDVRDDRNWDTTIPVAVGERRLTAKARYGMGQTSVARTFTVTPLVIVDPSRLTLSGANLFTRSPILVLTGFNPPGTAANRPGTGGTPPYTYVSSDTTIATVDSVGTVRSQGNGTAVITVRDSQGQTGSFDVTCSGVEELVVDNRILTTGITLYIQSQGGRVLSRGPDPRMEKYGAAPGYGYPKMFLIGYERNDHWGTCDAYRRLSTNQWVQLETIATNINYHVGTIYLK